MAPRFLASKDEVNEVLEEVKSESCSFDEGTQMVLPSFVLPEAANGAQDEGGTYNGEPYNDDGIAASQTADRVDVWPPPPQHSPANQAPTPPPRNQMPRETRALVDAYLKRHDRKARDARLQQTSDSQEQQQQKSQQRQLQKAEQTSLPQPAGNDTSTKQSNTRDFSGALMKHLPDGLAHVNNSVPSVAELRTVANFLDQRIKKTFGSGIDTFINKSEPAASEQQEHQPQQGQKGQPQIHPQFYQLQQKIEQQKQLVKGPNASPLTDPSVEGGLQDSISLEEYENPDVDDSEWEWIGPEG